MKLFDKVKNLFTEEVEEEPVVKKEVRHIEVAPPTRVERKPEIVEEKDEVKEEKFVFFSDDDFKDLEKPKPKKEEVKVEIKKEEPKPYRGATFTQVVEEKKPFKPSPIISPVYGVLDKNYSKDEVVTKKVTRSYSYDNRKLSVDDIRNKAYGTVEDEIKDELLGNIQFETKEEPIVNDIDIFQELEKYEELDKLEKKVNDNKENNIDDLFDELDNKKVEILDELDNKKDEILDELSSKKDDIINDDLDDDTLELSKQLETQRRKLDELNDFIEDTEEPEELDFELEEKKSDELNESELFDLIDSMYEKKDDE